MARTVLGRGLGALIPGAKDLDAKLKYVSVQQITPNEKQPRDFKKDQSFRELVQSVKQFGVLQPLIVKEKNGREDYMDGNYEIIAGERRFRAAKE
ncbi:MAG: ParB/RepB/Spo0J family partition protein, partial [Actinobacteria bacterium]